MACASTGTKVRPWSTLKRNRVLPETAGETALIHVHQMNTVFNIASPFLYLATATAMAAFVCFGVWSLQQRFIKYEEWAIRTQALILFMVLLFYILEINPDKRHRGEIS